MLPKVLQRIRKNRVLLLGKIRRHLMVTFLKKKVQALTSERNGHCRQCAKCCRLLIRCPFLTQDNLCRVYHSKVRPQQCLFFPIDQRDIQDVMVASGSDCGYFFSSDRKS